MFVLVAADHVQVLACVPRYFAVVLPFALMCGGLPGSITKTTRICWSLEDSVLAFYDRLKPVIPFPTH